MRLKYPFIPKLTVIFLLTFYLSSGMATASCTDGIDDDNDGAIDAEDMFEGGMNCYTAGTITYVSSSLGNDAWTGQSPNVNGTNGPKASWAGAQTLLLNTNPGDKVLLRRGDTWAVSNGIALDYRASGIVNAPVTLGGYGSGAQPSINSS